MSETTPICDRHHQPNEQVDVTPFGEAPGSRILYWCRRCTKEKYVRGMP